MKIIIIFPFFFSLALKRAVKKLSRTSLVETFWKNNRLMAFLFMYI